MKKLVLSVIAAGLLMPSMALTAFADYYDCNWQIHEGDPAPSECHMFIKPEDSRTNTLAPSGSSGRTSENGVNTLTPSGSSGRTTGSNSVNTLTPSGSSSTTTTGNSVNTLTPSGSASDLRGQTNDYNNDYNNNSYSTSEDDYYKEYYKKNVRDYCVRDVCYVLYDYCYDEIHCEPKKDVVARNEYDPNYDPYDPNYSRNRNNTWNYWINYYVNNYFYGMPMCNSRYQKCVYRGYHFGGDHNGYWPSQY